jgi:hypothetical protein
MLNCKKEAPEEEREAERSSQKKKKVNFADFENSNPQSGRAFFLTLLPPVCILA